METTSSVHEAVTVPPQSAPWLVVLCTPSDNQTIPPGDTQAFYTSLLATSHGGAQGTGGLFDYWRDQSYGHMSLAGTIVSPWTTPDNTANMANLTNPNTRGQLIAECVNNYINMQPNPSQFASQFYKFLGVFNKIGGVYCLGEANATIQGTSVPAACADTGSNPDQIAHEMGHEISLDHSFGDLASPCAGGDPRPGAYCDRYDIMSAANTLTYSGNYCVYPGAGCWTGPGLSMWNRYELHWTLEGSIIVTPFWPNNYGTFTNTYTIAPRNHPELNNNGQGLKMAIEVPAHQDSGYMVEFASPDGWDTGIGSATLLINRIYNGSATPYLLYETGGIQTDTSHPFNEGAVSIKLQSIQGTPPTATVRVSYSEGYASAAKQWLPYQFNGQCGGNFVADVTGDHKGDLVGLGCGYVGVVPSTGTSFGAYAQWANATFNGAYGNFVADVTGDGKADLVGMGPGYIGVDPSTGTSFGPYANWSSTDLAGAVLFVGDVTGDNPPLADVVAYYPYHGPGTSDSFSVLTSTGTSFGAPAAWYTSGTILDRTNGVFLADVNGDKRADLIISGSSSVVVLLSYGSGFLAPQTWYPGAFNGSLGNFVADVTGDGTADLLGLGAGYIGIGPSTGQSFGYETWSMLSFSSNIVTRVSDVNGDGMADLVAFNNSEVDVLPTVRAP